MALIDIDSKIGFLPDLVDAANHAQNYYEFQVLYLPIPRSVLRTDLNRGKLPPQLFLPRLEDYLKHALKDMDVELVCCFTRHMIAGEHAGRLYWNHFAGQLSSDEKVSIVSTYGLREYARQTNISFAKASLSLCLTRIIVAEKRWPLQSPDPTVGWLFGYWENQFKTVAGSRQKQFDSIDYSNQIRDREQLRAVQALVALEDTASPVQSEANLQPVNVSNSEVDKKLVRSRPLHAFVGLLASAVFDILILLTTAVRLWALDQAVWILLVLLVLIGPLVGYWFGGPLIKLFHAVMSTG